MEKVHVYAIVVTYNGLKWLDKCFGNLNSSSIPVKVIAIDNASTDGTLEYIRKHYPEVDLIENEKNLGFGQANNIGIRKAYNLGADYVFLLNQDAWVEKDTIEQLVKAAENNPGFGVLSPIHLNGNGNGLDFLFSTFVIPQRCPDLYSDIFSGRYSKVIYEAEFVNAAAWLISKKCIEKIGGFSLIFFHYGEDDNYCHRVRYHGLKVGVLPSAKIFHAKDYKNPSELENVANKTARQELMKFSHPEFFPKISDQIYIYKMASAKSMFKLNWHDASFFWKEYLRLKEMKKNIESAVITSKKVGPSFLNLDKS